jgi:filamentous hemagglutinin
MNRLQFRIVFNLRRGQFMAAAETVRSQSKATGQSDGPARRAFRGREPKAPAGCGPPALIPVAAAVAIGAVVALLASSPAHAGWQDWVQQRAVHPAQHRPEAPAAAQPLLQIKADASAPRQQQPTVLTAPNGIPLVNIQTPSSAGVSRNTYSQFDVSGQGVILNNARTETSTQLGGWVAGNPWMAKGEARVILNEVHSGAPSQLQGFVEVAGRRAEVIVANPAGIQVDGGGFINASGATLTTGVPRWDAAGQVSGFAVQGGSIRIDGAGLDARQTDYTALLARAVELNAGLWAQEARIQTGTQLMSAASAGTGLGGGDVLAPAGERPRYALDSSSLGGIYAQRITLVGTEAGLGVRQAGQMVAGQLTLQADGWLENSGTVYAHGAGVDAANAANASDPSPSLWVGSGQGVRNAGWLAAQGSALLSAPRLEGSASSVTAAGVSSDGQLGKGPATLTLSATQSMQQAGLLVAPSRLDLQAPQTHLNGAQAQAESVQISGSDLSARGATLVAGSRFGMSAQGTLDLSQTQLQVGPQQGADDGARRDVVGAGNGHATLSGQVVTLDGAILSATDGLQLQATGRLSARRAVMSADTLGLSAAEADLHGAELLQLGTTAQRLQVDGALNVDAARIATRAENVSISGDTLSGRGVRVEHAGSGTLSLAGKTLDFASALVQTGGALQMRSHQALLDHASVQAQSLDWQTGLLSHRSAVTQLAGLTASQIVAYGAVDNQGGRIEANGALMLQADSLSNRGGRVATLGDLRLDADRVVNRQGQLLSRGHLALGGTGTRGASSTLDNTGGQVAAEDVSVRIADALNEGGLLSARREAVLAVGTWHNADGRVDAGALHLQASRLEGAGSLYARGNAALTAGVIHTAGVLAAAGELTVQAGVLTTSGLMAAGLREDGSQYDAGHLSIRTGELNNSGAVQSGGLLNVAVDRQFNHSGVLYAGGSADVHAGQLVNAGSIAAQLDLQLMVDQVSGGGALAAGLRQDNTLATQGDLSLAATQSAQFHGAVTAAGRLALAAPTLQLQDAQILGSSVSLSASGGDLSLDRAVVVAVGAPEARNGGYALVLQSQGDVVTSRAQISAPALSVAARDWMNAEGKVAQTASTGSMSVSLSGDLNNQGGVIASVAPHLSLQAGVVNNDAGRIVQAGGKLQLRAHEWFGAQGQVLAAGALLWQVDNTLTLTGAHTQAERVQLEAGDLRHDGGTLLSLQDAAVAVQRSMVNRQGTMESGGGLDLMAGFLVNSEGTVQAGGPLRLRLTEVDGLSNQDGRVRSGADLTLEALQVDNRRGWVGSDGALSLKARGDVLNADGHVLAGQSLVMDVAALGNQAGRMASIQGGVLLDSAGLLDNSGGSILAASEMALSAKGVVNQQGELAASALVVDTRGGAFDNRAGRLLSSDSLQVRSGEFNNHGGLLQAQGTLAVSTAGAALTNTSDADITHLTGIRSRGSLQLDTGSLHNSAGIRGGAVTLHTGSLVNQQSIEGQTLALSLTDGLDNQSGQLIGALATTITAGTVVNQGGLIYGGELLDVLVRRSVDTSATDDTNGIGVKAPTRLSHPGGSSGDFVNDGSLRSGGVLSIAADNIDNLARGELSGTQTRLTLSRTLTNRGLIDGDLVHLHADHLLNRGSGRIYGGDITVTGRALTNEAEGAAAAVIASRGDLSVSMTGDVSNTAQSLIFADGVLGLRAASLVNENASIDAGRSLHGDITGSMVNRSVHDGVDSLPQDPNAPRVLWSQAFIRSGGDMALSADQVINSGATIEARGNLALRSAEIHNLNPYLVWQKVAGATTSGWEFQAPGSTERYKPDQIRVLWAVNYDGTSWTSPWGSDAQSSLEPFVYEFHPRTSTWSQDTYNRKMLLPSQRYPHQVFGRYLGGWGGDVDGAAQRAFEWRPSADHSWQRCDNDMGCEDVAVPGAHYAASDRVWSDFDITPGDDAALDLAMAAFYADTNSRLVGDFTAFHYTRSAETAKVTQSAAGQIIVGGALSVEGGRIVNDMSRIVGRDGVDIQASSIDNRTTAVTVSGREDVDVYVTRNDGSGIPNTGIRYTATSADIHGTVMLTLPDAATSAAAAVAPGERQSSAAVGSGGDGSGGGVEVPWPANEAAGIGAPGQTPRWALTGIGAATARRATADVRSGPAGLTTAAPTAMGVQGLDTNGRLRAVTPNLRLPTSSLFQLRTDATRGYLIATDPRYANDRTWLSSDYLLQALAVDPATSQKRLGDGFYEQRLVREQIGQLTGSAYLQGYENDEAMYRALLSNGASFAQQHQLIPGVALTAEQMTQLTTDLVWLVELPVTMADGSTHRVLVPQVYLLPRDGDLEASGALMAGNRVTLALSGGLDNSGEIRAGDGELLARADTITNTGSVRGTRVALSAREDVRNLGGTLAAKDTLSLNAGRDLVVSTTTLGSSTATSQRTVLDRVASLRAAGVMVLQAGRDVTLQAAQITQGTEVFPPASAVASVPVQAARGGLLVQAGRDLQLTTVHTSSSDRATFDASNHLHQSRAQEVGSSLQADGPVVLHAGRDLTARGASVNSHGTVQLQAERDVLLLAAQATESLDEATRNRVKGTLQSTTTTTQVHLDRTSAVGTTISGQAVAVQAGQDVRVQGSNVVSDHGTVVQAGRDVSLAHVLDTRQRQDDRQQVTSGVMGAGAGFTVGTRDQRGGHQSSTETVVASTVGSVTGPVTLVAGRDYTQTGSILQAPQGDVEVQAQKIAIAAAAQQGHDVQTSAVRQSGLSVSVAAPVTNALQSAAEMAANIDKVGDARMKALGAASTAIKGKEAWKALQADPKAAGGLSFNVTMGASRSESRSETLSTQHRGSEITAGGKVRLSAQGAGPSSSIGIEGSDIVAAQTLTLQAQGEIDLSAAQDRVTHQSRNTSSSAAVGVGGQVGAQGSSMGFTASASSSRGRSDGQDLIQRNTHLQGQQVTLESGRDTTLRGAVVSGDRVQASVGGDLRIESLQDTSQFTSSSQQAGGHVTGGAGYSGSGSMAKSEVNSHFASVTEQSGIRAGDAGFQVQVNGNTALKGGAVTSSQAAVDKKVNSFRSGSLTLTDLENKAAFEGSSYSVSTGFGRSAEAEGPVGVEPQGDVFSWKPAKATGASGDSAGVGTVSGRATRMTRAGISGVAGDEAARTGDPESGIAPIFDSQQVRQELAAQVAISQTFGKEAARQVGDFAEAQLIKAERLQVTVALMPPGPEREAVEADIARIRTLWGDHGLLRVAAHAAVGALAGDVAGAVGAGASPLLTTQVADALKQAGAGPELTQAISTLASSVLVGAASGTVGAVSAFNEAENNTNHLSPFREVREAVRKTQARLELACDPNCTEADFRRIDAQSAQMYAAATLVHLALNGKALTAQETAQLAQTATEMLPFFGTTEAVFQVLTGKSSVSQEEVSRFVAGLGTVPVAGPFIKRGAKTTLELASQLSDQIKAALKADNAALAAAKLKELDALVGSGRLDVDALASRLNDLSATDVRKIILMEPEAANSLARRSSGALEKNAAYVSTDGRIHLTDAQGQIRPQSSWSAAANDGAATGSTASLTREDRLVLEGDAKRAKIVQSISEAAQPSVKAILALDAEAKVGFRGSVASGLKNATKLGPNGERVAFDGIVATKDGVPYLGPQVFDVDFFVVSQNIYGNIKGRSYFKNILRFEKSLERTFSEYGAAVRNDPALQGMKIEVPSFRVYTPEEIQRRLNAGDAQIYFFLDENK